MIVKFDNFKNDKNILEKSGKHFNIQSKCIFFVI
jgi:hypothetical protein